MTRNSSSKTNLLCIAAWPSGGFFDVEIADARPGQITFLVTGEDAEALFANEGGGHRWQRVPPTEKRGRVQTSTVTVAILPLEDNAEVEIKDSDLEWATCRGSGPGGQNRNKLETAVQLWHLPSGIMVRCETERSQHRNKMLALQILTAKVKAQRSEMVDDVRSTDRKQQVGSGMRGDKRRTIRSQDGQVTDHITGTSWRYRDYVEGKW